MARTSNGTLEMKTDEQGLYTRATLNNTQQSRDVYEAVKRGDISQMSFAFTIKEDAMDTKTNTRTVKKVGSLHDPSAVSFPAYPTTTIEARSKANPVPEEVEPTMEEPAAPEAREATPEKPRKRFSLLKLIRRNLLPLKAKNRGK